MQIGRSHYRSPSPQRHGSSSARIAPQSIHYKQWTIRAHTPMSCRSPFIHFDPNLSPELRAFKPERWLEASSEGEYINHNHFVPFARCTRMDLGYNLGIIALGSRYSFEPYETDFGGVSFKHDWTCPQPRLDSQGVSAMVIGRATE